MKQAEALLKEADARAQHIAAYAFGSGFGHLTRVTSLLRELRNIVSGSYCVITNSPHFALCEKEGFHSQYIETKGKRPERVREALEQILFDFNPSLLVMDVFSFGIAGELKNYIFSSHCKKVLLYRYAKNVNFYERAQYFCLVLCPEDFWTEEMRGDVPSKIIFAPPMMIRNPHELRARSAARKTFKCPPEKFLALAVHTGKQETFPAFHKTICEAFSAIQDESAEIRFSTPHASLLSRQGFKNVFFHYPLMELFSGVDLLIGPAGYNLFHEAKVTQTPCIFLPQKQRFDDQFARALSANVALSTDDLKYKVKEAMARGKRKTKIPDYENGAVTAAQKIAGLLNLQDASVRTHSRARNYHSGDRRTAALS